MTTEPSVAALITLYAPALPLVGELMESLVFEYVPGAMISVSPPREDISETPLWMYFFGDDCELSARPRVPVH